MSRPGFMGFETPPNSPDAPNWYDRVTALYNDYPNQWCKYGPYSSSNSVNMAKTSCKKHSTRIAPKGARIETFISHDDDNSYYLYVIVRTNENVI